MRVAINTYDDLQALNNAIVDIYKAEFFELLDLNGAGKSALIRVEAGLLKVGWKFSIYMISLSIRYKGLF